MSKGKNVNNKKCKGNNKKKYGQIAVWYFISGFD